MTQQNPTTVQHKSQSSQEVNDLWKLFFLVTSHWYLFLLGIALAMAFTWLYHRHTLPTYRVTTNMLIEEGQKSVLPGSDRLLEGFGLRPGTQNLDNQIIILKSRTLVKRTLESLSFSPECYHRGRINAISLYPRYPLMIELSTGSAVPYGLEFTFHYLEGERFRITAKANGQFELDKEAVFGEEISFPKGSFHIMPHPEYWAETDHNRQIYFIFHDSEKLVDTFRERLKVETASREGTIAMLSLEGTNRNMDKDFLDKLTEVFLVTNLEKKNQEANRIIQFIDGQLTGISDSLELTGDRLEKFRSKYQVMDISEQGRQIIEHALTLENEKSRLIVEANYYDYLRKYLEGEQGSDAPIAPATLGISDPLLASLVQELASIQTQYQTAAVGERNPMQAQMVQQIGNVKESLRENLRGIIKANELAMEDNRQRIIELNARAATLPVTERRLLGIERQYKLNDALYTFLLEKRAEASIQKASNTPDNEVVDSARPDPGPIAPKKRLNYLFALAIGLGFPLLGVYIADALNNKVTCEDDIKRFTDLPIAGHILHSDKEIQAVVLKYPQDHVAEAFRSLRTRMQFFTREKSSPIILVTSSMPEEGKTFTALNLASAYSLAGKKTVLVGFDLRRPMVWSEFNLSNENGVSTYLIGTDQMEDILHVTEYTNLTVIPAGPIPPNPAELASSEKTREMFNRLKELYDYIIVDSAPLGTVSDSYPLAMIADATLLLVRHSRTPKSILATTLAEAKANGINELSILVNDLSPGKSPYGYGYRYGYGYGYGYGYPKEK